jgi:hypothetical protein
MTPFEFGRFVFGAFTKNAAAGVLDPQPTPHPGRVYGPPNQAPSRMPRYMPQPVDPRSPRGTLQRKGYLPGVGFYPSITDMNMYQNVYNGMPERDAVRQAVRENQQPRDALRQREMQQQRDNRFQAEMAQAEAGLAAARQPVQAPPVQYPKQNLAQRSMAGSYTGPRLSTAPTSQPR